MVHNGVMNSAMKRSNIPVKHNGDIQPQPARDDKKHISGWTRNATNNSTENQKLLTQHSSKKDLWEEKTKLEYEILKRNNKIHQLKTLLGKEKGRVTELQTESAEKEKDFKENIDEAATKCESLETQLELFQRKLMSCNVDPVSLQSLKLGNNEQEEVTRRAEQAQVKAKLLREKLQETNQETSTHIDVLQELGRQFDEINEQADD